MAVNNLSLRWKFMKGIKTVWIFGPGLKLGMRVRLSWIPSGDSMGKILGHSS